MLDGSYSFPSEAIPWVRQNLNAAWATFFRDCNFEKHISFQYLRSASFGRKRAGGQSTQAGGVAALGEATGVSFSFS